MYVAESNPQERGERADTNLGLPVLSCAHLPCAQRLPWLRRSRMAGTGGPQPGSTFTNLATGETVPGAANLRARGTSTQESERKQEDRRWPREACTQAAVR